MRPTVALAIVLITSQQPDIRVDVALRQVAVAVTDKSGAAVEALQTKDFVLENNGNRQVIAHVARDAQSGVTLGFLLDSSNSMAGGFRTALAISKALVDQMAPTDEFRMMSFENILHITRGFTDQAETDELLTRLRFSGGGTRMFPPLLNALTLMKQSTHRKRALIVVTDGVELGRTPKDAQQRIRESGVLIYPILLERATPARGSGQKPIGGTDGFPPFDTTPNEILETIAKVSGGRTFLANSHMTYEEAAKTFKGLARDIAKDTRGQYTLGYYPSDAHSDGKRIQVTATSPEYRVRIVNQEGRR